MANKKKIQILFFFILGFFSFSSYAETYLTVIKLSNLPRCLDVRRNEYTVGNTFITFPCHIFSNQTFWYDDVTGQIAPFGAPDKYATESPVGGDNRILLYGADQIAKQRFVVQVGGKMKGPSGDCWSTINETLIVDQLIHVDCSIATETWVIQRLAFSRELVSLSGGLCMEVNGALTAGSRIVGKNCSRISPQLWTYSYTDGLMRPSDAPTLCLGVPSGTDAGGEDAVLKNCSTTDRSQVINFADGVGAYLRSKVYSNYYDYRGTDVGSAVYLKASATVYLASAARYNSPVTRISKVEIR